jgi:hypothetical protein
VKKKSQINKKNDNFPLILIFYLHFAVAGATNMPVKDKNKITYGINFKVECPLCKEMIPVGYAGPNGLAQHQGKKKYRATCELDEHPIWPKFTPAYVEYQSTKTTELKFLSPQFVVHLTGVKHYG